MLKHFLVSFVLLLLAVLAISFLTIPFMVLILLIGIVSVFLAHARVKRMQTEEALQKSEERFKAIVAAIPIPMAITQIKDGSLLYVNDHYRACFNISPEQLKHHKSYHTLYNPKDGWLLLKKLKKSGYVHNWELQVKKSDGTPFWLMASFRQILFEGKAAMMGIAYDMTERKQTEEKIQQQHEFLQQVINSLDHPFYVINANNYQIELANSTTQALGIRPQATCYALTHKRSEPCTGANDLCPLEEIKKTKKPIVIEHIHFDKEGNPVNVEVHGFPIIDHAGNLTQMIEYSLDITERKQAEKQLHKQNEQLQAQYEQLDAFAHQLAKLHKEKLYQIKQAYERFVPREFLNLLDKQSILEVQLGDHVEKEITILFSDIREFTHLSENMSPQENFNFINSYLKQMAPVITQHHGFIDKYIGDEIMALFPTNANDAVQGAIGMLKILTKYNLGRQRACYIPISIGIGLNTGPLMLGTVGGQNRMDGTVISDAVNLASRVEQLTKIYGTPLLITEHTYDKLVNPSQYMMRVIDAVKVKGKSKEVTVYEIFDADAPESIALKKESLSTFQQGFVLYHCDQFYDARPFFEQVLQINPNDRTAQVYLERCDKILSMTMPEKPEILIVDDAPSNLKMLSDVLSANQFEVIVATDGETALKIVELKMPSLILLDIIMPGLDGFEVCQRLKANLKTQTIPIIFLTALSETVNIVKGFELGAVDYITKPFQQEEVLARVKTHLHLSHLQRKASWYLKKVNQKMRFNL